MLNIAHWQWPQITYAALTLVGLGLVVAKNGEPKTGTHSVVSSLIVSAIILWILASGGFFR
jgi:hypothetical protein